MAAHIQKKRTLKAREVALLEGISERTVRKYIAQPREDYEKDCYSARYHTFYDSVRKRKRRSERS